MSDEITQLDGLPPSWVSLELARLVEIDCGLAVDDGKPLLPPNRSFTAWIDPCHEMLRIEIRDENGVALERCAVPMDRWQRYRRARNLRNLT